MRSRSPGWPEQSPTIFCAASARACGESTLSNGRWRSGRAENSNMSSGEENPDTAGGRSRRLSRKRGKGAGRGPGVRRNVVRHDSGGAADSGSNDIDVVLLDHDLGSERASQFLPAARQMGFDGRVLVVTGWVSDNEARRLTREGVAGIFYKQAPLKELTACIRTVAAGEALAEKGLAG